MKESYKTSMSTLPSNNVMISSVTFKIYIVCYIACGPIYFHYIHIQGFVSMNNTKIIQNLCVEVISTHYM